MYRFLNINLKSILSSLKICVPGCGAINLIIVLGVNKSINTERVGKPSWLASEMSSRSKDHA